MTKINIALAVVALSLNAASCDDPQLKGMVSGINKNVPQRIDGVTTLKNAACDNGSLIYNYDLNDGNGVEFSKFNDQQMNVFKDVQHNILQQMYCSTLQELHKVTNSVIWNYDFDGKSFVKFEFKPSDCK
ncbi:MAG: hypothetical protein LUC34_06310 [Campylobacter sp.]|nr:hypothetical protein [Campylobacter sp.]